MFLLEAEKRCKAEIMEMKEREIFLRRQEESDREEEDEEFADTEYLRNRREAREMEFPILKEALSRVIVKLNKIRDNIDKIIDKIEEIYI